MASSVIMMDDESSYGLEATRFFGIFLMAITVSFGSFFAYLDFSYIVIFDIFFFALFGTIVAATYTRFSANSKELLMVASLCQILCLAIFFLGADSGFHLYSIGMIPASYVSITRTDRWSRYRMALLCCAGMIFAETQTLFEPIYHLGAQITPYVKMVVIVSLFSIVFGCYLYFFRVIDKHNSLLRHMSEVDDLTQLANRRRFIQYIARRANRSGRDSLLLIDLDKFKEINDRYGHAVGDEVLINVSGQIRKLCGRGDLVARLGGEEFAMLLADTSPMEGMRRANQLCELIAATPTDSVIGDQRFTVPCTVSIGLSQLEQDFTHSLTIADNAMYQAKENGRNQVVKAAQPSA